MQRDVVTVSIVVGIVVVSPSCLLLSGPVKGLAVAVGLPVAESLVVCARRQSYYVDDVVWWW